MTIKAITVRGARTHNLKNIDLVLPHHQLIVITGPSGSGKSSLAFDTLYAEGQRRYVESLSAYARQFLSLMEKPDVDLIEGLSPAISIEQKSTSHNPRSTVGTITEIYDYLRLLFARVGEPHCPTHGNALHAQTVSQMVDQVLALPEGTAVLLLAPIVQARKGEYSQLFETLSKQGFVRARIDGKMIDIDAAPTLNKQHKHTIEVVVDRIKVRPDIKQRLAESFATALKLGNGLAKIAPFEHSGFEEKLFSAKFACPECGYSLTELEPRLFSFNNPQGACANCEGLGHTIFFDPARVVHDPSLSLAQGAIRGWDLRYAHYAEILNSLASHYRFSLETPFEKLTKKIQNVLLYGSKNEEISFRYQDANGRAKRKTHAFEGVLPNMERRYHDTESEWVRQDLVQYIGYHACPECDGSRLCLEARNVLIEKMNLPSLTKLPIQETFNFFDALKLAGQRGDIAKKIVMEISNRLQFLINVGLEYLTLDRSAETLSGGEAQRIRLASQIGAGLVGVLYVLDEPTIGLHQRDNARLLKTLMQLKNLGNTVIVVEHDEDTMHASDLIIDMGPGAGKHGGEVVAQGNPQQIMDNPRSLTGAYLSGRKKIAIPKQRKKFDPKKVITLSGVSGHNLKNITAKIPLGLMTCVTGVSGSGKSTLINDTLYPLAATVLNGATQFTPKPYHMIEGLDQLDKVINIDQSPIGRTPRSNPATYTGLFTAIRELFAGTVEARTRGYNAGRFSFNVKGGRCEACQGDGVLKVEMHFLADIYVTCDVCKGERYNRETLDIHYKGKTILDILNMTVEEANEFFAPVPTLSRKLQMLMEVGLSYIQLGQNATTLSGGEAQRVKLAKELAKRDTGTTLYILDEPTTGLHFNDVAMLLAVLQRLRDQGNTLVIIEHHLDVIKTADWIIDLGPEGGDKGGTIVVAGTPEQVANHPTSYTGHFLKPMLTASKE